MQHPWSSALVTGASSGIGAALARQLIGAGVDVTVVARRRDRLVALAAEFESSPTAGSVTVVEADLADPAERRQVAALLADPSAPVELLVNCAGIGASGPFVDGDVDRYHSLVELNVTALVELTQAALRPMVQRGRGWILNVSSLGGHAPGPRFAVYSASKAFVTSFSESLHEEVHKQGVVVTVICPGATHTEFGALAGATAGELPRQLWQTADEVAAEGLTATADGRALRVTGRLNRATAAVSTVMPRVVNRKVAGMVAQQAVMRIAIGSDHAGFELKTQLIDLLSGTGHEMVDLGTHSTEPVDYPPICAAVGRMVAAQEVHRGIVLGGSGQGEQISANKVNGVRAALCNDLYTARYSRLHNDANVLSIGARVVGSGLARDIVALWLDTEFEGGRHQRRIDQISELERRD